MTIDEPYDILTEIIALRDNGQLPCNIDVRIAVSNRNLHPTVSDITGVRIHKGAAFPVPSHTVQYTTRDLWNGSDLILPDDHIAGAKTRICGCCIDHEPKEDQ